MFQWKGGCLEVILNDGKQGETAVGGGHERGPILSVYSHIKNMVETLSWVGAAIQSVLLDFVKTDAAVSVEMSDFDLPCSTKLNFLACQ